MTGLIQIAVSCPDEATARALAEALVSRRLAACAHVEAAFDSAYWWKGAVERARETGLTAITRADLFDRAAAAIRALHPYETPAILARRLDFADPAYADWVRAETEGAA